MQAEQTVAKHFQEKHFQILKTRWRTPFAEVDLLLQSPQQEIWLVEVKTLSSFDFLPHRVGRKQHARLRRALSYVQTRTKKPVCLCLAFVDEKQNVLLFEGLT